MKRKCLFIHTLAVFLATMGNAYGATDMRVYNSGFLVVLFLGFCALVVIAQLVPAFLVLAGMIKGLLRGTKTKEAKVETGK